MKIKFNMAINDTVKFRVSERLRILQMNHNKRRYRNPGQFRTHVSSPELNR